MARRTPSAVVLGAIIGLAVLVGVSASLLLGSAPAAAPQHAGQIVVDLPTSVWGLLFLSPLIAGLVGILYQRFRDGSTRFSGAVVAAFVVILLLGALALYFALDRGSGQGAFTVTGSPGPSSPGNGSGPSPPGSPGTSNNSTTVAPAFTLTLNGWTLLAIVVGLGAVVGALSIPGVLSRVVDPRPRNPAPAAARRAVQAALADAGAALERGEDPRATIIRLYLQLLAEIAPRTGDTSALTAQEIHYQAVAALGVSPPASEALVRLFEEARYSTHPLGPADAGRCRSAIEQVERDLARSLPA